MQPMRLRAVSETRGADEFWHSGANVRPYFSPFEILFGCAARTSFDVVHSPHHITAIQTLLIDPSFTLPKPNLYAKQIFNYMARH